jgi:hypothetical protein
MATRETTEAQILEALHTLDPTRWDEVLDFIVFLTQRTPLPLAQTHSQPLTAADVLQSELVGLWADRSDIDDNVVFARQLRQQAEHRLRPRR